jgi:hypothetical protein
MLSPSDDDRDGDLRRSRRRHGLAALARVRFE